MLAFLRTFLNDEKAVPPDEVRRRCQEGAVLVDVRTPPEFTFGHLQGALNVDANTRDFDAAVASLDKSAPYYLYCTSGRRSERARDRMRRRGFTNVHNAGRLDDLAIAGIPVER